MKIIIKGRSPSWNKIYQSKSWYTRREIVDDVHARVQYVMLEMGYRLQKKDNYFKKKVDISLVGYFKHRPLDSDNIPAKLYIDGLKDYLLSNDAFAQVGKVSVESKIDPEERVEIVINERKNS